MPSEDGAAAEPDGRSAGTRSGRIGAVTMADIAAGLGVSAASVSNALNRPERVSTALRERVLTEASRLGYVGPSSARRRLPGGRSRTAGIAFTSDLPTALGDAAATLFLQGLADACEEGHLNMMLLSAADALEGGMSAAVASAVVDGFVVYSVRDRDPLLSSLLDRHLPTVVVDAPRGDDLVAWVGSDDHRAMRALGTHLAELNHRKVGIVAPQLHERRQNGPADPTRWSGTDFTLMRLRMEGLSAGLSLGLDEVVVEERFEATAAAGGGALHALLDRRPDLTAVCCLTDEMALGALRAARRRGLDVPGELTVTGFDDIPAARSAELTTVSQAHREKGRLAGDLLLELLAGGVGRRRTLPTHLEVRGSSGRARTAGP